MKRVFKASKNSIDTTGGGRFLTEFGLCAPDNSTRSINTIECNTLLDMADENFQSWTYWDSLFFDPNGKPIENQVSFQRDFRNTRTG
ncbi:unnamed protein product [Protopolystoma xenopodis]|uniref:Glycoside hydrolase family 5 domain-containing protein n=1 Tax=Protopolystoma xenopodis TaxID=117903 RepID=A0A448WZ72_9PLAT|nr:unnamed protein product [Protopolystoma xenopodis]